jgi:hypothetical protein
MKRNLLETKTPNIVGGKRRKNQSGKMREVLSFHVTQRRGNPISAAFGRERRKKRRSLDLGVLSSLLVD